MMGFTDVAKMRARVRIKGLIKTAVAMMSAFRPSEEAVVPSVAVLMYHRVSDCRRNELSVSPREFRRQVHWLNDTGFKNMRMAEIEEIGKSRAPLPDEKRVVFSFDDGYEDNFTEAFPILRDFGYTGMFYLAVNYIGTAMMYPLDLKESGRLEHNRIMSWQQVTELIHNGMEIGSHTLNHAILTRISDEEARLEISDSKQLLERKLGIRITSFCYPGGHFNERHEKMLREAGFYSACTTKAGMWRGDNLYRISRAAVLASDSLYIFKMKVSARMEWFQAVR